MLKTVFGSVFLLIDGQEVDYTATELPTENKRFSVDGRYAISVDIPRKEVEDVIIECGIEPDHLLKLDYAAETGEDLALNSFFYQDIKLSIGTTGDIPYVEYAYLPLSLKVIIHQEAMVRKLRFFVAWIKMNDPEKEYNYTWFAADPTLND